WEYEQKVWSLHKTVAGVDEAGRGPLAGPVVAAAVLFHEPCELPGLRDSKKMSEKKREELFDRIRLQAQCYGVAACGERIIDRIGILQATYLAMKRALALLPIIPDEVLVDGRPAKIDRKHIALVKGDDRSFSIAAASVLAKVQRDRMMLTYHAMYPEFEFNLHKGYPTPRHKALLKQQEPCPLHRMTFSGVQYELFS
ncbi:MAG: ribonuclease HII, partial [bacterium]|nr:ribonuclease HII [bacterium]